MVNEKFYYLFEKGDVVGEGDFVLCTQQLILLKYLERFMQVHLMSVFSMHC